jgi:adenine-specific DNA-methyltransferase
MPLKKRTGGKPPKRPIERYEHSDKTRINNPPVGLVTLETDPVAPTHKTYDYVVPVPSVKSHQELDYDPHLDPQLVWAGKKEHTSFEVPTVSLHVHERIDPHTIMDAVRKRNGNSLPVQASLFERREENPPFQEAIDFYRHPHGWSNRIIAGDSLLVMNSLLEKEGMASQVQMVYIDPPYGIRYGSNFQPFINKREVSDGKDEDLTQEPEMIRAFRDTWELNIHSYLTYLRDRLLLARDLLHESGSCFVQISDENLHLVRCVMDEVFGSKNSIVTFPVKKKGSQKSGLIDPVNDYVLWYGRSPRANGNVKFRALFEKRELDTETIRRFNLVELPDGRECSIDAVPSPSNPDELVDYRARPEHLFRDWPLARLIYPGEQLTSGGERPNQSDPIEFRGEVFRLKKGLCWKTTTRTQDGSPSGIDRLKWANRLAPGRGGHLNYKRYLDDFGYKQLSNWWDGLGGASDAIYVVQTTTEILKRCILMTTDPGDLVLDPTCGSGTTAYVAEQWGRRWITCDTSRVAITLTKQRLMAADFDYYELAHPEQGVGSGLKYKSIPHVTLGSIANNPELREGMTREQLDASIARYADPEALYDQPYIDKNRVRVTGPFTVEAVPAPTVRSLEEIRVGDSEEQSTSGKAQQSMADFRHAATPLLDASVVRSGPTLRHTEWRDELLKTGLRGKGGNHIDFSRVEPLAGTRWLHADAETKGVKPERVVISFGPEHSLLDPRQVESAWQEARTLIPKPAMIVFAAFEFDPQAAKEIDELTKEKTGMTFLSAQMNADLLTADLKKKRASSQGFWLVGRPDVDLRRIMKDDHKGKWEIEVKGFDYYNTRTGTIDSGDVSKIAMWLLDTDYDSRSLYPRQVFFPLADAEGGWARLAKNLKAEIDPDLIEAYRGTVSLPFEPGNYVAVKVIDDRGIESLKVVEVK